MLFNSIPFLIFFPLVTVFYYLTPRRQRWITILIASVLFYMALVPAYILVLFAAILIDYYAGLKIEAARNRKQKKFFLVFSIFSTCLILFTFKYYNFFLSNIHATAALLGWNLPVTLLEIMLPVGLSFHTFQSLSYVIEVYRGNQRAERHLGIYSVYVMFYPQLVAGPIERPQNLLPQFHSPCDFNADRFWRGLQLMLWGMFKKVVIADRLAVFVNSIYRQPEVFPGVALVLATVFFAFQIYCDFSGYSDIARGSAETLGVKLMINFDRPYLSRSISEFWKRWHISLSTWFRDYVYLPLGGNRCGKFRHAFNLWITFLISGLWHGANWTYVAWGALNGFYLVFAHFREHWVPRTSARSKIQIGFHVFCTFTLICISWVFFRADTMAQARQVFTGVFGIFSHTSENIEFASRFLHAGIYEKILHGNGAIWKLGLSKFEILISIGLIVFLYIVEAKQKTADFKAKNWVYAALLACIVCLGIFNQDQFIYFQF